MYEVLKLKPKPAVKVISRNLADRHRRSHDCSAVQPTCMCGRQQFLLQGTELDFEGVRRTILNA